MQRAFTILFLIVCVHLGWKHVSSINGRSFAATADMSIEQIRALAATVKPEDVVIYTTNECGYCGQAKNWLREYGFAFSECNLSADARCEQAFRDYGANGTPYLVVQRRGKTHHMKEGFDTDEFLAALQP